MKPRIGILLALLLFFCLGCQPTPAEEIVVNKGDGAFIAMIAEQKPDGTDACSDEASAGAAVGLEAPAHLSETFSPAKNLTVHIEADVILPEFEKIPVLEVVPDEVTEAELQSCLEALIGDLPIYKHVSTLTKKQLEAMIKAEQEEIADPASELNQMLALYGREEYEKSLAAVNENIEQLRRQWETAPEEIELEQLERRFYQQKEAEYISELQGRTLLDNGCAGEVNFQKYPPYTWQRFEVLHPIDGYGYPSSAYAQSVLNVPESDLTEAEAVEAANALLEKMGLARDFTLSQIATAYRGSLLKDDQSQCYMLYYERLFDGIPSLFCSDISNNVLRYQADWPYEMLSIGVGEMGVVHFEWISPIKTSRVLSENVSIMDFEALMDRFEKSIAYSYVPIEKNVSARALYITSIEFGYTRIAAINQENTGILTPSWSFYGYEVDYYDSQDDTQLVLSEDNSILRAEPAHCFLTLNALDGSVIDRSLGY